MRLRFVIVAQTQGAAADDSSSAFRLELTGDIFEAGGPSVGSGELTPSARSKVLVFGCGYLLMLLK